MCMRFHVLQPWMQNDYHKNRFAFRCISKQPKTHYSTHQLCEFFPLLHFTAHLLNCCTSFYMLRFKVKKKKGSSANSRHHKFHGSCTPVLYFSNPVVLSCYLCHHFTIWPVSTLLAGESVWFHPITDVLNIYKGPVGSIFLLYAFSCFQLIYHRRHSFLFVH